MPTADAMPADNLDFAWDRPETVESLRQRFIPAAETTPPSGS